MKISFYQPFFTTSVSPHPLTYSFIEVCINEHMSIQFHQPVLIFNLIKILPFSFTLVGFLTSPEQADSLNDSEIFILFLPSPFGLNG